MTRRLLALVATSLLGLAACNDDGRTLAPAPTVPVSRETTTTSGVASLTLSSPAFSDGGLLDPAFTCDGVDVSPPLDVAGVPAGAVELAIVVVDTSADRRVHWVLTALPATLTRIEPGLIPPDARSARGDGGIEGWDGPCPPVGDPAHAYEFTVHALPEPAGLAPGIDGRQAIALLEQASIGSASVVARYERA